MQKTKIFIGLITLFSLIVLAAACGGSSSGGEGKVIKSVSAGNNLTAAIATDDGVLRKGDEEFTLTFTDASGKPVDIGAVSYNHYMPAMGSMSAMNNAATLSETDTPGVYRGKVDIEMAGEWQAQIVYEGSAGKGKFTIPVNVQ